MSPLLEFLIIELFQKLSVNLIENIRNSNKMIFTTFLRMPEMEKPGGMSYEVVLEGPKKTEQPIVKCPSTPTPSVKDIEKKLKVKQ